MTRQLQYEDKVVEIHAVNAFTAVKGIDRQES
jgi:hypothetical protein